MGNNFKMGFQLQFPSNLHHWPIYPLTLWDSMKLYQEGLARGQDQESSVIGWVSVGCDLLG